jgi:hypothetical protein
MDNNLNFIGTKWQQHCGDILTILRKSPKAGMWFCQFEKYPFIKEFRKDVILRGEAVNPQIEIEEFKNKIWEQHCGDSLRVLRKTDVYKNKEYLWECEFIEYPYKLLCDKSNIKNGTVVNPQIEQIEFIDKIWPQNCGDSLRIIEKINDKKGTTYLFKCEFINLPFITYRTKKEILKGICFNPLLEEIIIGNIYKQNYGDDLKVIEKIAGRRGVYKCEFIKYKNIVFREKSQILKGGCINPLVEQKEFVEKVWHQKCGYNIKILKKYNKKGYWQCLFVEDNTKIITTKRQILEGTVIHPNSGYISLGEKELKDYISSLYKEDILFDDWSLLNNYEIDIYIPNLEMGFEFNGIYWHSQKFKDKNYHLDKLKLANSKGIKLYYIWEDEWRDKQEEIKIWLKELIINNNNISKEVDKLGYISKSVEPKLIQRDKFYCWSCG